jgi:nicotinamide mononucleotide transporter
VILSDGVLEAVNGLALVTGVAYAVLAARRNRLCWIAGAISSAAGVFLSALGRLPMQAGLQVFYVGMAAYGWWSWKRSSAQGELPIGTWPLAAHLAAAAVLTAVSFASAHWLQFGNFADWPLLDSLTVWFSLLATWLAARARIENWLYWIVINPVMVFLFYVQKMWGMALLSAFLAVIAIAGFAAWRRRLQPQGAPA